MTTHATRSLLPRLRHAPQRQHPGLPRARGNRRRRPARGVLRGAAPQRPPAPAGGILPRRRGPLDPRPPRRAQRRLRAAAALAALEPRRLRPLPGVGLRGRHHRQRRLRGEADVGLLRRLRQPPAQHPRATATCRWPSCCRPSSPTSPSSASSAPTRCARRSRCGRRCRPRPGARTRPAPRPPRVEDDGSPPYRSFIEEHRPQLRFHYRAIDHLLEQLLIEEASLGRLLRALRDQADPRPLRELRRRLRDQHPQPARAPRPLARPTASSSSRG